MDPLALILWLGLALALVCLVGIIRNWNKRGPTSGFAPHVYLTGVGWILAVVALALTVGAVVVLTLAGVRINKRNWVYALTCMGVTLFLMGRWVLGLFGIQATRLIPPPPVQPAREASRRLPGKRLREIDGALVGRTGVTLSPLRPSGLVDVGGAVYEASAQGVFVEAGTSVKVVGVARLTLQVEPQASFEP